MSIFDGIRKLLTPTSIPPITGGADAVDVPDVVLDAYQADLHRQNLVTLGRDYKPEEMENFRRRARYGDPRFLYAFYDEMQRMGPTFQRQRAVEAMKSASATFTTFPEDYDDDQALPEGADPAAVATARAARDFLEDTLTEHLTDLIEIHSDQHFYGISDCKLRLLPRGNSGRWESIECVDPIPARRHRLDPTTHKWMLMPSPDAWDGVPIESLLLKPDRGLEGLFFCEIGRGAVHLDQRGLFFQVLVPWCIQQYVVRWRAKNTELFGVPWRVGKVDYSNAQRKADMLNMLKSMGSTAYAVVHKSPAIEEAIELLETNNNGAGEMFEMFLEWIDRQYDKAILGHSQVSGVQRGAGSRSSAAVAADQFQDLTNSRLRTFSNQLRNNLAKTMVARNFGPDVAAKHTPLIKLRFVDRDDPDTLAAVALKLYQANAGDAVALEDLVRRCSLRVAQPGEKTLGSVVNAGSVLNAGAVADPGAGIGAVLQAQALRAKRDAAPDGIGDEVTDFARQLVDKAVDEDWPPNRLLAEMTLLGNHSRPTPKLKDRLAAAWAQGIGEGISEAQTARAKKVQ